MRCFPIWLILINLSLVIVEYYYIYDILVLFPNNDFGKKWIRKSCRDSTKGGKPPLSSRNCKYGKGDYCTKEEPCTPCDDFIHDDGDRCLPCSDYPKKCNFDEVYGPYCLFYLNDTSTEVRPCEICCYIPPEPTEPPSVTPSENNTDLSTQEEPTSEI